MDKAPHGRTAQFSSAEYIPKLSLQDVMGLISCVHQGSYLNNICSHLIQDGILFDMKRSEGGFFGWAGHIALVLSFEDIHLECKADR